MVEAQQRRGLSVIICTSGPQSPLSKQNWALGRAFAASGSRVILLVDRKESALVEWCDGCEVVTWPSPRPVHWRDAVFLFRLIRRFRPDAILGNFGSVNLAMIVGRLCRVPIRAAWYRTLSSQIFADQPDMSRWRRWWLIKRKAFVYRLATHIVPVSDAARTDVSDLYGVSPAKCRVVRTCRADPRDELGPRLPGKVEGMRIVCVARLHRSKGQDILIQALRHLLDIEPGWPISLDFVGDGPERSAYEALVSVHGLQQRVTFSGSVPHVEALGRIAMAHVMAVPFRTDAGPGVVAEGLGLALPLVITSAGGMREQVGDSACAILVPPEDPVALASALHRVLGDPDLSATMSAAGRELFLSKFHLGLWVADVSAWLNALGVRPMSAWGKRAA